MKYKSGYKYAVFEDCSRALGFAPVRDIVFDYWEFRTDGTMTLKKGFMWDGASGPTWDDSTNIEASAFHDAGYQAIRHGLLPASYKPLFDKLLMDIMIEKGASRFRAWYYYQAVSKFGTPSTLASAIRKVLEA